MALMMATTTTAAAVATVVATAAEEGFGGGGTGLSTLGMDVLGVGRWWSPENRNKLLGNFIRQRGAMFLTLS